MAKPTIHKLTENEAVFRKYNKYLQKNICDIDKKAKAEGLGDLIKYRDRLVDFYCECSDDKCEKRVSIKPSVYKEIHDRRDRFIVKAGHEIGLVEKIISVEKDYVIVEKKLNPPENPKQLNKVSKSIRN